MSGVILQPASDKTFSRRNYVRTIVSPVPLTRIAEHLSPTQLSQISTSINTDVSTWGIKPSGIRQWEKIEPGDTVLFSWDSQYRSLSTVLTKIKNVPLARDLWGDDGAGNTWELIYFVQQPIDINIPYEHLNTAGGFKPNYVPQGVNVVKGDRAERILTAVLGVLPTQVVNDVIHRVDAIETLERVSTSVIRGEQAILRSSLVGNSDNGICGICGKEYPVNFLIAAHIKKRSKCTDEEKRDIPSIAMPMCLMGCDALFEAGYVTVEDGVVIVSNEAHTNLQSTLNNLSGNNCIYWDSMREQYFSWHKNNTFKT